MKNVVVALMLAFTSLEASASSQPVICMENLIPVDGPRTIAIFENGEAAGTKNVTLAVDIAGFIPKFISEEISGMECKQSGRGLEITCSQDDRDVDGALENLELVRFRNGYQLNRRSEYVKDFGSEIVVQERTYGQRSLKCVLAEQAEVDALKAELKEREKMFQGLSKPFRK